MDRYLKPILEFIKERDWEQFHNPKDVAISLSLEASEVLEHFQWKTPEEIEAYLKTNKDDIGDELADVLFNLLMLAHYLDIDIETAFDRKLEKNRKKYPVEKAKGSNSKYTKYQEEA